MAANKIIDIPPIALTATLTTNILNCAITSLAGPVGFTLLQPYLLIRHFRVFNKTGLPQSFSFWKGASAANTAGTEFLGTALSVPANQGLDFNGLFTFEAADFLVGGASLAASLILMADGAEVGFR